MKEDSKVFWETVIGLEIHVQINSQSKAFCADRNQFTNEPNVNISPITLAHPGTLPRVNEYQIKSAVKLGLAFGSVINQINYFDRKNYFYPDLPKGYQITQDTKPICVGGSFSYPLPGGEIKKVRIHHLHMEEDAGKSIHDQDPNFTLLDYNRAGVPLVEIVTEPDLRTSEEVFYFIQYLQIMVRNLNISDGNMEEGSFRCDCNVSVMPKGSRILGIRCEIKNLNSKKFAKQAIEYESARQIKILENGGIIKQTTLLFDSSKGITYSMRDKEEVNDYRYFNDPDLPPVHLTDSQISAIKSEMVPTPIENFQYLNESFDLKQAEIELLIEDQKIIDLLKLCEEKNLDKRESALLIINKIKPDWEVLNFSKLDPEVFVARIKSFIDLFIENKVSKTMAYQNLYEHIWKDLTVPVEEIALSLNLMLSEDSDALEVLVSEIITANPDKVKAYNSGKKGLIGFFMGEGMKKSKGKYDPQTLNKAFTEKLTT